MRITAVLLTCVLILISCTKKEAASNTQTQTQQTYESVISDEELLHKASEQLIKNFGLRLKSELNAALDKGGPVGAISVCQIKAPEIAKAHSNQYWTVRRVSDKSRNPLNAMNDLEKSVFAQMTAAIDPGGPTFVSEWRDIDGKKKYFHYKQINVAQLCLNCHGRGREIEPAVRAVLEEKYPEDQATGYKLGEIRGMFVVEVTWPEGQEYALQIAQTNR